jgi:hypothetical protein
MYVSRRELVVYVAVVLMLGTLMNTLGKLLSIAEFKHWWQVGTCYVGYVLPVALLVRRRASLEQLVLGLVAMVPLELVGYALGTSVAYPDNVLERAFGTRNFTLAMVVLVAPVPWCVNRIAASVLGAARASSAEDPRELFDAEALADERA